MFCMSIAKTHLTWENYFIQESIELEEKIPSFEIDSYGKSKIRLCLEKNILEWSRYETWMLTNSECASLKSDLNEEVLESFVGGMKQAYAQFSNHEFWSEDLLPFLVWDGNLIVIGLHSIVDLQIIKNHIFILASPEMLNFFSKKIGLMQEDSQIVEKPHDSESTNSAASLPLEGLTAECLPSKLDFKSIMLDPLTVHKFRESDSANEKSTTTHEEDHLNLLSNLSSEIVTGISKIEAHFGEKTDLNLTKPMLDLSEACLEESADPVWEFISERHEEYYFEAKKNFNAYVVLKINKNKTEIFKMDSDLEKQNFNKNLFNCDLSHSSPLTKVFKSGLSESFEISQMGWAHLNYKYVCLAALKHEENVIGFLVGFKENHLSEADQILLMDLAKESAA